MYSKDELICFNILESVNKIIAITKNMISLDDLKKDFVPFDAVMMNFIIIGEMAGKLSEEFKEQDKEIEWHKIYTFRNIVVHDYFGVDEIVVWQIIQTKIPLLKKRLEAILDM
jgi:uncharacterized protein with HEPN domain